MGGAPSLFLSRAEGFGMLVFRKNSRRGVGSTKIVVWRAPGDVGSTKIVFWRSPGAAGSPKIVVWRAPGVYDGWSDGCIGT